MKKKKTGWHRLPYEHWWVWRKQEHGKLMCITEHSNHAFYDDTPSRVVGTEGTRFCSVTPYVLGLGGCNYLRFTGYGRSNKEANRDRVKNLSLHENRYQQYTEVLVPTPNKFSRLTTVPYQGLVYGVCGVRTKRSTKLKSGLYSLASRQHSFSKRHESPHSQPWGTIAKRRALRSSKSYIEIESRKLRNKTRRVK